MTQGSIQGSIGIMLEHPRALIHIQLMDPLTERERKRQDVFDRIGAHCYGFLISEPLEAIFQPSDKEIQRRYDAREVRIIG